MIIEVWLVCVFCLSNILPGTGLSIHHLLMVAVDMVGIKGVLSGLA